MASEWEKKTALYCLKKTHKSLAISHRFSLHHHFSRSLYVFYCTYHATHSVQEHPPVSSTMCVVTYSRVFLFQYHPLYEHLAIQSSSVCRESANMCRISSHHGRVDMLNNNMVSGGTVEENGNWFSFLLQTHSSIHSVFNYPNNKWHLNYNWK